MTWTRCILRGLEAWVRQVVEQHIRMALFDAVDAAALSAYGRSYLHKTACLLSLGADHTQYEAVRDELDVAAEKMTAFDSDVCKAAICAVNRGTAS